MDDYADPNWEPEPMDAGPGKETLIIDHYSLPLISRITEFRANKPADVLTTLVSIYDSKDLFVKELQILLAQRLLAIRDGNYDREVIASILLFLSNCLTFNVKRKNIEILKLRFGDAALQVCEVMLRDMTDSRRIDQHIQAQNMVSCFNLRTYSPSS